MCTSHCLLLQMCLCTRFRSRIAGSKVYIYIFLKFDNSCQIFLLQVFTIYTETKSLWTFIFPNSYQHSIWNFKIFVWRFKMVFPYFNMHFLNFDCHIRKISSGYCWGRREGSWRITGNVWICLRTQENLKNWTLGTTVMKAVSEQFLVLKVVIFLCLLALFFWESALLFLSQVVVYAYPSCTRNSCLNGIYTSSF